MHFCLDLAYFMRVLSRSCNNDRLVYVELVKHILKYISRTLNLALKFDRKVDIPDDVVGYIDSNFAELNID